MADDNNHDAFAKHLKIYLPENLDDIIKKNRHLAELRLSTEEEIMDLYHPIDFGRPKNKISDWRLITLYIYPLQQAQVMLVGNKSNGLPRITSVVRKIDLDRQLIITNTGSLYELGTQGEGEPGRDHLFMICYAFHQWGFGAFHGVPYIFY